MRFVKPSVNLIESTNPLKKIEIAGRNCYKSDSEFTDESAKKFTKQMINRHHFAMLEHGEFTFLISGIREGQLSPHFLSAPYIRHTYRGSCYIITVSGSHVTKPSIIPNSKDIDKFTLAIFDKMKQLVNDVYLDSCTDWKTEFSGITIYLAKNFEDLVALSKTKPSYISYNDLIIHNSVTLHFICDRGVSHELVRHRYSSAQESQRYCNYSKDKFGDTITFIYPHDFDNWESQDQEIFVDALNAAENAYFKLIECGKKPEQARAVLPNATKTEVILTMPIYAWLHFIDLRSIGTTGKPHPDMQILADEARKIIFDEIDKLNTNYLNQ